jgi:hypothetical protein
LYDEAAKDGYCTNHLPKEETKPTPADEEWRIPLVKYLNRFCVTTGANRSKVWNTLYKDWGGVGLLLHSAPLDKIELIGCGPSFFEWVKRQLTENLDSFAVKVGLTK